MKRTPRGPLPLPSRDTFDPAWSPFACASHSCRQCSRKYHFSRNCLTRQGGINVTLTPAAQKFVLHWGEMGQAWGINRTMAQVHALLFVAPTPLDAEEISTLLDVSRSNVSTSLRELITWGVVRRVHIIGDRRDRFEALKDVMETFRVIMAERKRREMDPTIALLEHCVREAKLGRLRPSNTPANNWRRCSSSPGW